MEGVPRLPMLKCELKRSPDNEGISRRLRELIAARYGSSSDYEAEIREFKSLRATSCILVSRSVSGVSEVKKYYSQLSFLKNRLRLEEDFGYEDEESGGSHSEGGGIPWSWYNLYSEGSPVIVGFTDVSLEMSSVLYNVGALHSILADEEPRVSSEEMKMACTHFQCAAWAFHTLPDRCSHLRSTDLDPDVLAFLSQVCLAQAQECILEKSILDHRKASIVAKVGAQVLDYYLQAKKKLDGSRTEEDNICEIVGSKLAKVWLQYVDFKMHFYTAVSYYYMGLVSEEAQKMGERVTYFEAASGALKTAAAKGKALTGSSLAKKMFDKALIGSALSFSSDVMNGKLDNAKKENDFIYHEGVPELSTLPELKGASLVKGIGFEVTDAEVSGKDIFSRLVPMEAHESSSLYSEEKAKLLRNIGDEVEKKDTELAVFLTSLSLDEIPAPGEEVALPPELIECVAGLSGKKDAISRLSEAMKQIDNVTCSVDTAIKDLEDLLAKETQEKQEFEALMGSKRNSTLETELKRELKTFMDARSAASDSTSTLHNAMELHLGNFHLLHKPLDEIERLIPSMRDLDEESESNLGEMLRIYDKVKEMKSQRIFLLNKLRDEVQNDDITKKLILYKNRDLTDVFSSELKKYDSSLNFLRTNLEAQGNILKIFADINAKYVDTRCTISELLSARKEMINSLIQSYHTYDDLLHKTAKGLQFYDKLESNVAKALSKAKGVVKVQAEERDALIAKNSPRRMPTLNGGGGLPSAPPPSSSSGKPTLKDYLNAMKGHEAGKESPTHGVTPHYNHVPIPKQSNEKEDSASPVVAPPIAYPPPRSTYTSGTLPSSNNLSLATASPQIQQQEQIRQYYSPPNTTAAYQYPASASSNASIIPGTHPSPQSKEPNSMNKNTSYVQQPNNYYGQSYYYNTNPGANTNASPYMQPQHVTPQKPSHSNNNNPYGQYSNSPSQTPHHPYVSQQYAANAYNNYQSQQAYTHKYNIPPNNSSNTIPGGAYSPHNPQQQQQQHTYMNRLPNEQNPFLAAASSPAHNVPPPGGNTMQSTSYSYTNQMVGAYQYANNGNMSNPGATPYAAGYVRNPAEGSYAHQPQNVHHIPPANSGGGAPCSQPQIMSHYPSSHQPPQSITPLHPEELKVENGRKSSVDKILSVSPEEPTKKHESGASASSSLSHESTATTSHVLTPKVLTASDLEEEKELARISKEIKDACVRDPYEASESLRRSLLAETNDLEALLREIMTPNSIALEKIWKEVKDVFEKGPVLKISVARCYPMKNRDADVLPYDNNRVELPSTKDDYINASHIRGLSLHCPRFIATQSPSSCTLSDFWIMVWQEQVETLVNLVPEDTPSTFVYWPVDRKTPLKVGSLHITLQSSKIESPHLNERIMTIANQSTNTSRVVVFIQAIKPITDKSLLLSVGTLLLKYHRQQRSHSHPIILHCQFGSFRTASVILLASLLSEINIGGESPNESSHIIPSLPQLAGSLLRQRKGIFKEKESLKMVYEALLAHCQSILLKHDLYQEQQPPQPTSLTSEQVGNLIIKPTEDLSIIADSFPVKKITKQDFLRPSSGLNPNFKSDDPLSQLDPLWSLKSKS